MSPRCSLYESMHCVGGARRWASCRSQSSCFAYNARPSPIVFNANSAADPSEPKKVDASSWGCYPSGTIGVMGASCVGAPETEKRHIRLSSATIR
jgi:hypothetical protein